MSSTRLILSKGALKSLRIVLFALCSLAGAQPLQAEVARASGAEVVTWESELRVQKDGGVVVTDTVGVRLSTTSKFRGIFRKTYPRVAASVDGAKTLTQQKISYEPMLGFIDGKSATVELLEKATPPMLAVHQPLQLPPGLHTFVMQYLVRGVVFLGKDADLLMWPAVEIWSTPIPWFSTRIVLPQFMESDSVKVSVLGEGGKDFAGPGQLSLIKNGESEIYLRCSREVARFAPTIRLIMPHGFFRAL